MKTKKYLHYKNKEYEGLAKIVSNGQEFMLYRALYQTDEISYGSFWLRPWKMFHGLEGDLKRFIYVGDLESKFEEGQVGVATYSENRNLTCDVYYCKEKGFFVMPSN